MQLDIKKMKPIRIVGDSVTARPSSDIKESCCVRRPKPSPASKLNEGPAKQAAILGRFQEKEKGISILSEIMKRIGKKKRRCLFSLLPHISKTPLSKRTVRCPIANRVPPSKNCGAHNRGGYPHYHANEF